jgi:predicted phosphodiesterase
MGYQMTAIARSATIISDIHGVTPALEAVLDEESRDPSDLLVVLGDTAAGPMPNETVELLRRHADRLVVISGNGDRNIVEIREDRAGTDMPALMTYAASAASDATVDWLRNLPGTAAIEVQGIGGIFCCHAVPANDMDIVLVDTRMERWQEVIADVPESCGTVALGHTHMPFQRLAAGKRVINPGSVGMNYGATGAHWVRIRDGVIETRVTHFGIADAIETLAAHSTFPDIRSWARDQFLTPGSDAEVIALFGPRDGR